MLIQVNTDNHIVGGEALTSQVEAVVEGSLGRFTEQITRVEVHLHDNNSHKQGDHDKHCRMEARIAGHQPVSVSHESATLEEAIDAAAEKLERALDSLFGKLGHKKGRTSYGGDQTI